MENNFSVDFTDEMVKSVLTDLSGAERIMPFLTNLSAEEKINMLKLGDKSRPFVEKALELVLQNDTFLPRNFDVNEFKKDVTAYLNLFKVLQAVNVLQKKLEDTFALAGSEAYSGGLVVYSAAKRSNTGGELDTLIDELSKRFIRKQKEDTANGLETDQKS